MPRFCQASQTISSPSHQYEQSLKGTAHKLCKYSKRAAKQELKLLTFFQKEITMCKDNQSEIISPILILQEFQVFK